MIALDLVPDRKNYLVSSIKVFSNEYGIGQETKGSETTINIIQKAKKNSKRTTLLRQQ